MKQKELTDIHDDFKLKKNRWSPWFIQKYFSAVKGQGLANILLSNDALFIHVMHNIMKECTFIEDNAAHRNEKAVSFRFDIL